MANRLNTTFRAKSRRMRAWYARRHDEALSRLRDNVLSRIPSILEQPCRMKNLPRGVTKTMTRKEFLEHLHRGPDWP